MGKPDGFLEYTRQDPGKRPIAERINDFKEIEQPLSEEEIVKQAARCMDCGIPYCHACGCPVENIIPEFNDMVYRGQWRKALDILHATNNFPEFTGRICPAPCEASCTLGINQPAVTICHIEQQIAERGWREGWIVPEVPERRSGRKVAVVGSGPAGLAAAQQLARAGHEVVVFEEASRIGGLLRYGIPDFKLDKAVIDRRLEQMRAEGVVFETNVRVGEDISIRYLLRSYDAILLAGGARVPRDLQVEGRSAQGIHFAMEFLTQQNRLVAGDRIPEDERISAKGKHVVVIGGGDTGSDCIGTSIRQGAASVVQLEIMPEPPEDRAAETPWPLWPYQKRTSSSQAEGCERRWSVMTRQFLVKDGCVAGLCGTAVAWKRDDSGKMSFEEVVGGEFEMPAELVLLAMGFTKEGNAHVLGEFGVNTDDRGDAILDGNFMTNIDGIFAAGDLASGASLVVRAIAAGRRSAEGINRYFAAQG